MNNPKSDGSRKLLWILLAVCFVTTIGTVAVTGWLMHRKSGPATRSKPLASEKVVTVPIVLAHEFTSEESRRKWGPEVPHGTQVLDNVTFFVDGGLRVASLRKPKHPGAVLGIPIRRKGTTIHLLQAGENVGDAESRVIGAIYGRLRFHFANGESRDFTLRFGVHGRDWWQTRRELDTTVSDPNTTVGWLAEKTAGSVWIRLFHTALENPFPNEEITAMDVISALSGGNLLLFAIAIGDSQTKLQPPSAADWPAETSRLAFSLKDGDGKAVSGGSVRWEAVVPLGIADFPAFPCDASGRMNIDFVGRGVSEIHYVATDRQGAATSGTITMPATGWLPTQQVPIVLERKLAQP